MIRKRVESSKKIGGGDIKAKVYLFNLGVWHFGICNFLTLLLSNDNDIINIQYL